MIAKQRLPIAFILLTLVIDAMGIGLIMPVMPELIKSVAGGDLANAAIWGGLLTTIFAIMQFLFSPFLGNLSDRFGRRPLLLASMATMALDYLVMALAGTLWLLFVGRLVGGILAATQSIAAAFMADISHPQDKAANFGLLGAAFGVGFVLGPLIGGLMATFGPRAPFYAAAALAAVNFCIGYFVLPETLSKQSRRPFDWRRANPLGAFRHLGKLPDVRRILLVFFIYELAFFVYPSVWAYFALERFGWDARMVGLSLASFGISIAIAQGLLIKRLLAWLGTRGTVLFAFTMSALTFLVLAFLENGLIALLITPLTALGVVATPALQAMGSQRVGDDQQGELQGAITSVQAVAVILSPLLMTQIFAYFTRHEEVYMPGAPFLLSLALMIVCVVLFQSRRRLSREEPGA